MEPVGCRGVSWGFVLSFLQLGKASDLWLLLKNIPCGNRPGELTGH